ncbi:MAG: hypothetical protein ACYC0V_16170 [Armatimonadota bacterium]
MDSLLREKQNNDNSRLRSIVAKLRMISKMAVWCLTLTIMSAGLLCADAPSIDNPNDIYPRFDRTPHITLSNSSLELGSVIPFKTSEVISDPIPGTIIKPVRFGLVGLMLPPDGSGIKLVCINEKNGKSDEIALTWQFRYRTRSDWSPWMDSQTGVMPTTGAPALLWEIDDQGISHQFEMRCIAQIDLYQMPGRYATNIQLCIAGCEVGQ